MSLTQSGFSYFPQFFDCQVLSNVKDSINTSLSKSPLSLIGSGFDLTSLPSDLFKSSGAYISSKEKLSPHSFKFSSDQLSKGVESLMHQTNAISIKDPLIHFPELLSLALNTKLTQVLYEYFKSPFFLTFAKIRKHFPNNLPDFDTNHFHYDDNVSPSTPFVKVFVPLQPSFSDADGKFSCIPRSMIRNESIINESGFFDSDKFLLSDFFDSSEIVSPSIQLGDIFIASTTKVLHKGTKPIGKDRILISFNYCTVPEYGLASSPLKVHHGNLSSLTDSQIQYLKYLTFV